VSIGPSGFKEPPPPSLEAGAEQKSSFEMAADRARARFPAEVWSQLGRGQRSQAIFDELRVIDEEVARTRRGRR
jgi:hypothetical protein